MFAVLAAATATTAAQQVPFAKGPPGDRTIVAVDEATLAETTVIAGVEIEPLELVDRSRWDRLRADLPREADAPARVALPGGGSVYRLRGSATTTLLLVPSSGLPSVLFTAPDAAGTSSVHAAIAVSADGSVLLGATTLAAGGDVFALDLTSGAITALTAALLPLDVAPDSLRVEAGTAWFVADDTLYSAEIAAGAALAVDLGSPPELTQLSVPVVSRDGSTAAIVAGDGGPAKRLYAATTAGVVTELTSASVPVEWPDVGADDGPRLAVSADGAFVAWRQITSTQPLTRDVFVGRVAQPAPELVTGDAAFVDTLDNAGIIGFTTLNRLLFVMGETSVEATWDAADLYAATVAPTGDVGAIENLSLTSGDGATPFTAGDLEIFDGAFDPSGERMLLTYDPQGGDAALATVDVDVPGTTTTWLDGLEAEPVLVPAGTFTFVISAPDTGNGVPLGTRRLHLLRPASLGGALQTLFTIPPGVAVDRFAVDDAGALAAFVASAGPGAELGVGVDLATGGAWVWWPGARAWSSTLAFTPSGGLAAAIGTVPSALLPVAFDGPSTGGTLGLGPSAGFPLAR